jgi:hypothetical protein
MSKNINPQEQDKFVPLPDPASGKFAPLSAVDQARLAKMLGITTK